MKVLIVSTNDDYTSLFVNALKSAGADDITVADSYVKGYDAAVFSLPLTGRFGLDEAVAAAKTEEVFVMAAATMKNIEKILEKIGDTPLLLVPKPVRHETLTLTFRNLLCGAEKSAELRRKLRDAENKISDLKLIERAKFVLAEYLSLTEAEAHRYIQKNAMDRRVRQAEVAKDILKTYEVM
jgi:response regulator NasT